MQSPEVPVRVTVAEGKHQKVTIGVGYGTEEQARARLRWDHLNFLGGARHAGFEGKWSSLDRGVRAEYREPFFLRPHFSLNFDGQAWQAAEPVYSLNSLGGRVDAAPPGELAERLVGLAHQRVPAQHGDAGGAARTSRSATS